MSDRTHFDVIVAGLGAAGSASAYQLARRGLAVAGLDPHHPPHDLGSSHGSSRIIREAYAEDPLYVPILRAAWDGWRELEEAAGRELLVPCGGLMIGPPGCELIEGVRLSAELHRLSVEELSATEIDQRFGGIFDTTGDTVAIFDPRAGLLRPEACIEAMLACAEAFGARFLYGSPVVEWLAGPTGVTVTLENGTHLTGEALILAAGAWMSRLAPALAPHLTVTRQVLHWFGTVGPPGHMSPQRCPVFVWEHDPPHIFYGFPDHGEGLKVAIHHEGEVTTPEAVNREVAPSEVAEVRELTNRLLPGIAGDHLRSAVCMYTNTPDGHFVVDRDPEHPNVVLASPCSGHGFKFMIALGEILADLAEGKAPRFDLSAFGLERLRDTAGPRFRVRTGATRFEGSVRD